MKELNNTLSVYYDKLKKNESRENQDKIKKVKNQIY